MSIEEIKGWDDFAAGQKPVQFLQSYKWGEFQEKTGRQIVRLKGGWGQALAVKYVLPFDKSYLYCPRSPVLESWDDKAIDLFLTEVKNLAKKEKSIFLRFEPPILNSRFQILDSRRVADVQPAKTVVLDLAPSEEELLRKMHYKTRYNIRLAQRQNIKIREGGSGETESFLNLLHQTTKRDKFRSHPDNYYRQLLSVNQNFVKLFLAEHQGRILAANIIIFFGDTATYSHGASSDEYKNLMAPHLLQWEVIRRAKQSDYRFYDFWGIDENKWPGITRFKRGFGGQEVNYSGTFDLIFNKFWYQLYRFGKLFKKF